jgi:L-threonylcarbamoyladenylate synthase
VYGLAGAADDARAVQRIFELKGRPEDKALQVLISDAAFMDRYAVPTPEAQLLAQCFWPGPLTLILPAASGAPACILQGGTIGLRLPAHATATEVIDRTGPLAATSANRSGQPTPSDIETIRSIFGEEVAAYVDGGRIDGEPSTVVDMTAEEFVIRREGAIATREIQGALGF